MVYKMNKKSWICPKCGFEIKASREKHFNSCDGRGPRRRRPKSPYSTGHRGGWNKGLTKENNSNLCHSEETKLKLSKMKTGLKHTEETKKKLKNIINKRYDEGWDPKAGRAPKYLYKNFTVDGSWELEFCKWADENNIYFERNIDRFKYKFEEETHKYKPDFKLQENLYVEVKGYQTDKDLAKWNQFPYKLIVLKRNQINKIKKRTFKKEDLFKYIWNEQPARSWV
jgi:hypothetical protein